MKSYSDKSTTAFPDIAVITSTVCRLMGIEPHFMVQSTPLAELLLTVETLPGNNHLEKCLIFTESKRVLSDLRLRLGD